MTRMFIPPHPGLTLRECLYRALSPKGNPTLATVHKVLAAVELRLSVTPAHV